MMIYLIKMKKLSRFPSTLLWQRKLNFVKSMEQETEQLLG
jgi:hypothetical protein